MATGVKKAIEPIRAPTGVRRGGSRPKPPKAGARSASLEAPRPTPDHETAKQRLTGDTVAGPPPRAVALGTHWWRWMREVANRDLDASVSATSLIQRH